MANNLHALEAALVVAMTERQRIDALNALAHELRDTDSQRGLDLATTAYALLVRRRNNNSR